MQNTPSRNSAIAPGSFTSQARPAPPDADAPAPFPEAVTNVSSAEALALPLTDPQRTAIQLLTSGQTLVASAAAAGVTRMTLYRWLKRDATFIAAFNAWQQDAVDTARGRVLSLSDLAVSTVAKSLTRGDAKTALKLLDKLGILDRPKPGSTDPAEVQRQQDLKYKKRQSALRKQEARAEMESFQPL